MKSYYVYIALYSLLFAPSNAQSGQLVDGEELEPVAVSRIEQSGNLMPGPGRPRPITSKIRLTVPSNGCTVANDFNIDVEFVDGKQLVTVVRVREDRCRAIRPNGQEIELTTKALGPARYNSPIVLRNPLFTVQKFVY